MKKRFFPILAALLMLSGGFSLQACFYTGPPSWYGSKPAPVGDYDDGHVWHDRDWWVSNHHDWVREHHPDWVANETQQQHEAYEHQN